MVDSIYESPHLVFYTNVINVSTGLGYYIVLRQFYIIRSRYLRHELPYNDNQAKHITEALFFMQRICNQAVSEGAAALRI